ncbi:MAG: hypothetical protein Q4P24_16720 [Rhodobacterales bacterium]|nr:hypothetical protein [Rhodobacterales bacterium]
MQRLHAVLLLLIVLVTVITAFGMKMMPLTAPASNAAAHADH